MTGVIITCWRWLIRPLVRHTPHPHAHTGHAAHIVRHAAHVSAVKHAVAVTVCVVIVGGVPFGIYEAVKPAPPPVGRAVDVPEPSGLFVMLPLLGAIFWIRRKR